MQKKSIKAFAVFLVLMALTGCGGGGGGGGGTVAQSPTKSITAVKTAGLLPAGQVIGGIQLTITMPLGVTVQIDPVTHNPTSDVVKLIGASDPQMVFQGVDYTPATSNAKGKLKFMVFNAAGFGPVEYINVQLDVSPGFFPSPSDFSLTDFAVSDITNYDTIQIANPVYTVDIK